MNRVVGKKTAASYPLNPLALIGQGAEGRVFRVGAACCKVLDNPPSAEQVARLEMLEGLGRKVPGFAWPTELVLDPATGDVAGFAMDLVPGESLESLRDSRSTGAVAVPTKVRLALKVARAVAEAHAHRGPRIVLGDVIKAGNLVIDGDDCSFVDAGSVSLFGYRTRAGEVRDSTSTLTTSGYVPKEVLDNPSALPSQASDLFALPVVLFELLFGRFPHEVRPCPAAVGLQADDAVRRGLFPRWVADPAFEAPSYDPIDLPDEVDRLFRASFLATAIRPPASDWCEALEAWLEAVTPRPQRRPRRKKRRRLPRWLVAFDLSFNRIATRVVALFLLYQAARWAWDRYASPPGPPPIPSAPRRTVGPPAFKEIFR